MTAHNSQNTLPTALVTGSTQGIGRALALALAEDGFQLAIHYRSSRDRALEVKALAEAHGVSTQLFAADLTVPEEAQGLIYEVHKAFGRLDVLINNVGNYHQTPLEDMGITAWHDMFSSNLHATFYTCQTAVPLMRERRYGRIINIGFAGAEKLIARPSIAGYAIAKTGVILYSKALAKTTAQDGITVNVISPGIIENTLHYPKTSIPMGRLGRFADMVGAMRYVVSDAADYVTGVTIEVSGGWNV